jgi:hypothetical protein
MVRLFMIVLLVGVGAVSAVMAIGGLPWRAGPAATAREDARPEVEAAQALTDQALTQLRRAPLPTDPDPDAMQALTRSVLQQLRQAQGTPLERAVRQAMQASQGDTRIEALLSGAPQARPAPRPPPLEQRLHDLVRRAQEAAP